MSLDGISTAGSSVSHSLNLNLKQKEKHREKKRIKATTMQTFLLSYMVSGAPRKSA